MLLLSFSLSIYRYDLMSMAQPACSLDQLDAETQCTAVSKEMEREGLKALGEVVLMGWTLQKTVCHICTGCAIPRMVATEIYMLKQKRIVTKQILSHLYSQTCIQ